MDEEMSQLVPIIRYQDRELPFCQQDTGRRRFLPLPECCRMDGEDIHAYIKEIENKQGRNAKELEQAEKCIRRYAQGLSNINQFGWHKEQVDDLYEKKG
jgi:hypothetical protein